jgi:hypothetical protein
MTVLLNRYEVELTLFEAVKRPENSSVTELVPVQINEVHVVSDSPANAETAALALVPSGPNGYTYSTLGFVVTSVTVEQANGPQSGTDTNGNALNNSPQQLPVIPAAPFGGASNYHLN